MKSNKETPADRRITLHPFGNMVIFNFEGYTDREAADLARLAIPAINQAWSDNASRISQPSRKP